MSTLFTFGCSYTEDFHRFVGPTKDCDFISAQRKYIENNLDGKIPKSWPQLLSEKLGFELKNYGVGGISNYQIFEEICEHSNEFKNDDIVIVGWTHITRFRWAFNNGGWSSIFSDFTETTSELMNEITHSEILVNRTNKVYINELYQYQKLLEQFCKLLSVKLYFWSSDDDIIYKENKDFLNDKKYLLNNLLNNDNKRNLFNIINSNGGKTINEETNGEIPDNHLGESGHKVQAELFYNYIKNEYII
jgi:hypothetical protein